MRASSLALGCLTGADLASGEKRSAGKRALPGRQRGEMQGPGADEERSEGCFIFSSREGVGTLQVRGKVTSVSRLCKDGRECSSKDRTHWGKNQYK